MLVWAVAGWWLLPRLIALIERLTQRLIDPLIKRLTNMPLIERLTNMMEECTICGIIVGVICCVGMLFAFVYGATWGEPREGETEEEDDARMGQVARFKYKLTRAWYRAFPGIIGLVRRSVATLLGKTPQILPIEKEMTGPAQGRWEKWKVFYEETPNIINFRIWIALNANEVAMDSYIEIVEELVGTYASHQSVSVVLYKGSSPVRRYSRVK